jgi:RNase P subunit RPR2
MKVLVQGNDKWSKKFTCKGCSAVLEAEQDDIEYRITDAHTESQQYQLEIEGDFIVSCPECGQETKLKDVPPNIKEFIKNH